MLLPYVLLAREEMSGFTILMAAIRETKHIAAFLQMEIKHDSEALRFFRFCAGSPPPFSETHG